MAKQARTVLSLAFGLAVRYDSIPKNPVRDTTRLHKPPSQAMALTVTQVEAIRAAVRGWRRCPGLSGPPPDGQLEHIIEVMLGTSARIREVLAIRKCDIDATGSPAGSVALTQRTRASEGGLMKRTPRPRPPVRMRSGFTWVPFPARGDFAGGALVPPVRVVPHRDLEELLASVASRSTTSRSIGGCSGSPRC